LHIDHRYKNFSARLFGKIILSQRFVRYISTLLVIPKAAPMGFELIVTVISAVLAFWSHLAYFLLFTWAGLQTGGL
jgi:hypothetical protein